MAYAVKEGRHPGIYNSWSECETEVKGFQGALYKSFSTKKDAQDYLQTGAPASQPTGIKNDNQTAECTAYVDGSYDNKTGRYSFGVVLLHNNDIERFCQCFPKGDLSSMHNVAGELMGATTAIKLAIDRGYSSLLICHDYMGISEWATGAWKANLSGTKAYKEFINSVFGKIELRFRHVKGHTGVEYNEMVDRLAAYAMTEPNAKNLYAYPAF